MRMNKVRGLILLLLAGTSAACGASKTGKNSAAASPADSPTAGAVPVNNRAAISSRVYTDPDGAFAVNIPVGWRVERNEGDGAYLTVIRPEGRGAANLSIMTVKAAPPKTDSAELQSFTLNERGKPFFKGWVDGLKEQARVEGTGEVYPTQFSNSSALRMDLTYYRDDADDPRLGRGIFLIGSRTTFFVGLTAARSRFRELEEIAATLRIEP